MMEELYALAGDAIQSSTAAWDARRLRQMSEADERFALTMSPGTVIALVTRAEQRRRWISQFGEHGSRCPVSPCTCGLAAALEE
jgi:hypothetical protein